ncbi:uncharacterized protein LOC127813516 [Diospyros lotus]|uniref:uncharacterized protein LOC127813516 n=1 Tax=Diospyros lotus TaxID=55363 RepID=UPI00224FB014|nr:uncharacterized protein LOC127813516 [Diospyros lotus]
MGNCSLKGVADASAAKGGGSSSIRVMTDSGRVMQFEAPKLAGEVTGDFPGYGLFGKGRLSSPLQGHEQLHGGQFYYLLPVGKSGMSAQSGLESDKEVAEPVRMSTSAAVEVLLPPQRGVWRVKLVIATKQLEEILAEEVNTEALIEQMRLAASSASVTPRKSRVSWGVNWKPMLVNMFKGPVDHQGKVRSPDSCPDQGKDEGELVLAS